jgi:predicted helicase
MKIRLTMPRVKLSRADRNPWLAKMTLNMHVFKQKQTHINIISFLLQESTHIKQITSIGKMLKSSFPFCDSDQISMSSHNVQTSLFRYFRRDAAIWVDIINEIQKRNNKLYIMEESSHTWLKYTCRMCKVCLYISFLPDFSMSSQNVQYGKNLTLFFISLPFA